MNFIQEYIIHLFIITPQNAASPYYEHNPYKSYEECIEAAITNKKEITMATIKSYTDLEQSKKLAEILPLESADMWWAWYSSPLSNGHYGDFPMFCKPVCNPDESVPCWSLAALLGVLPKIHKLKPILDLEENSIQYSGIDLYIVAGNPIDACFEMILKLHELKKL